MFAREHGLPIRGVYRVFAAAESRLKANIDIRAIAEEEVKASGWDRRDYA